MELLEFYLAIFIIIAYLFYIYYRWRLWPKIWAKIWAKIWGWVLSKRKKRGLETASSQKPMEGKSSSASIIEAGKDIKNRKLIRIVISHLVLYLFVLLLIIFGFTYRGGTSRFWFWDTRYTSPTARNIILLVIVIVVFPLVSVVYELERRKIKRKKKADIQNKKNPGKIKQ